ncbi:ATP-binding protein [Spirillospora sp. NPDC047279]|uniref:ATP-binding protein n=1 Tax=Spirillospora sp. NPDC047279 TaxID=3155478 RepID=UPI0033EDC90E
MELQQAAFTWTLKPIPESAKEARDLLALAWSRWELGDAYTAKVVVSELITNAVRACTNGVFPKPPEIVFRCLLSEQGAPIIEVRDNAPGPVEMGVLGMEQENGRGLPIVDALPESWCVVDFSDGSKAIRVEMST